MAFFLISSSVLDLRDADLLTVVSDRFSRGFNRSGATRAVTLDTSKAFDKVWHAGILHKRKSCGISGQIFGLISSFLNNRRLRVVLDGKSRFLHMKNKGVWQSHASSRNSEATDV